MTQIVVTLDEGVDAPFLQRMIENMKGVLETHLSKPSRKKSSEEADVIFDRLEQMRKNYDPSFIDVNDERTRYLLSK